MPTRRSKSSLSFPLPANITKIAITLTQDGSAGGFAVVQQLKAQVLINNEVIELVPNFTRLQRFTHKTAP